MEEVKELKLFKKKSKKGKKIIEREYRFANEVLLYDEAEKPIEVNWCGVIEKINGKKTYENGFVTEHEINKKNVEEVVNAGRGRWKIENENNNTLKQHGYNLEHNFGHGENLAFILVTLNLLAFLIHSILSIMERRYQLIMKALGARQTFFNDLKALLKYQYF